MEQTPSADPGDAAARTLEVAVARTGGFAGLTKRWTAQPPEDDAPRWIALIDRCPWDAVAGDGARRPVADGFVWVISVRRPRDLVREAELPDDAVTGAWRDLVDAVRAWEAPPTSDSDAHRRSRAGRRPE